MSDPRSLAETLYDESLGDDAGSLLRELLDLHAIRTGQNTARHAGRILSGAARAGRQGIDDSDALRRIAAFPPRRCREAVGAVARLLAGPHADKKTIRLSIKLTAAPNGLMPALPSSRWQCRSRLNFGISICRIGMWCGRVPPLWPRAIRWCRRRVLRGPVLRAHYIGVRWRRKSPKQYASRSKQPGAWRKLRGSAGK